MFMILLSFCMFVVSAVFVVAAPGIDSPNSLKIAFASFIFMHLFLFLTLVMILIKGVQKMFSEIAGMGKENQARLATIAVALVREGIKDVSIGQKTDWRLQTAKAISKEI